MSRALKQSPAFDCAAHGSTSLIAGSRQDFDRLRITLVLEVGHYLAGDQLDRANYLVVGGRGVKLQEQQRFVHPRVGDLWTLT